MKGLYRFLLFLFPSSFRAEYGEEMCWIFATRLNDANSVSARFVLLLSVMIEVPANAMRVHFDILAHDLRYTARMLGRIPGFAFTAIFITALGAGATTAAFSIADHVLLRPLPFPDWQRFVKLWESEPGYPRVQVTPPNYRDWKRMSTSFDAMGAFYSVSMNLTGAGEPQRIEGATATADVFQILGIEPVIGRLFTPSDEQNGAPATVLLSYGFWQTRFNSDPSVIGRKMILDHEPYEVIGIMPQNFLFPGRHEKFWTPIRFTPADFADRDNDYLQVIAKLKESVSLDEAKAEMRVITAQLEREYPVENAKTTAQVIPLRDEVSRQSRVLLTALVGASLCVLLITSANLANLLLARSMVRRKELAVRSALGAGRERLIRQLLTESLFLAALGGILGIVLAHAATPLLGRLVPNSLPVGESPVIDLRVLVVSLFATVCTGVGFGLIPALKVYRGTNAVTLHSGSRNSVSDRNERFRSALIIAEICASVILLVSSGLLLRALWKIQTIDPGFQSDRVLTLRTWLPWPEYEQTARRTDFYTRVLSQVRALPNVADAAYISYLPMVMRGGISPVTIPGRIWSPGEEHYAAIRFVTPGFFKTLRIPIKQGRDVSESDTLNSNLVAVVSESFAQKYWANQDPLGKKFEFDSTGRTVVGVAGNILFRGLERESEPQVYLPYQQVPDRALIFYTPKDLLIRFSDDRASLIPAVRQIIRNVDPDQPVSDIRMLSDIVEAETTPRGIQLRIIGTFATIAILLASIGIHGLLSYAVTQRKQEFGVRIALGAQSGEIFKLVLRDGAVLAFTGILTGTILAYAAARMMETLLAGITPADPLTFIIAISVALMMTLAGSLIPAFRAVKTDPATAIRSE